jgi:hypothetical protein
MWTEEGKRMIFFFKFCFFIVEWLGTGGNMKGFFFLYVEGGWEGVFFLCSKGMRGGFFFLQIHRG